MFLKKHRAECFIVLMLVGSSLRVHEGGGICKNTHLLFSI